jgi:hypothetical protein
MIRSSSFLPAVCTSVRVTGQKLDAVRCYRITGPDLAGAVLQRGLPMERQMPRCYNRQSKGRSVLSLLSSRMIENTLKR